MRTNIEIDDELMRRALALSGLGTKRAVVHAALEAFVEVRDTNRKIMSILTELAPVDFDPQFIADYEAHRAR